MTQKHSSTAKQACDLLVIGAGSGGVRAARMAAGQGAGKVVIAESRFYGGTCVNVGCVPKKLFHYGAHFPEEFALARSFGWQLSEPVFDWQTLKEYKNREIERLNGIYESLLTQAGVEIVWGEAAFLDSRHVQVGDVVFEPEKILIATGSESVRPGFDGCELALTSDDLFYLETLPRHACVMGGGYIAVEFAGILHGLGVETHLFYRGDQLLRGFDEDIRTHVTDEIQKSGVHLHFNRLPEKLERQGGRLEATLVSTAGGTSESFLTDAFFCTIGRRPNTRRLNLDRAGVQCNERGAIAVNEHYETSVPGIFAIGDVIDRMQLTPVALAEAMYVVDYLWGSGNPEPIDYARVPTAVFSSPNVATVGLTEEQARKEHGEIQVFESRFTPMKHSFRKFDEASSAPVLQTYVKMIVDAQTQRVLGIHMVGDDAGEIIQGCAVAITAGATKADFDRTIGIHPTAAEELVTLRQPRREPGR